MNHNQLAGKQNAGANAVADAARKYNIGMNAVRLDPMDQQQERKRAGANLKNEERMRPINTRVAAAAGKTTDPGVPRKPTRPESEMLHRWRTLMWRVLCERVRRLNFE